MLACFCFWDLLGFDFLSSQLNYLNYLPDWKLDSSPSLFLTIAGRWISCCYHWLSNGNALLNFYVLTTNSYSSSSSYLPILWTLLLILSSPSTHIMPESTASDFSSFLSYLWSWFASYFYETLLDQFYPVFCSVGLNHRILKVTCKSGLSSHRHLLYREE